MQLSYAVKFEDFKTLQPPFTIRAGNNAGFKGVLIACGLIGLLGVFCMMQGMGVVVGGFLIGLGLAGGVAAYFYEQGSVRLKTGQYEKKLAQDFQQIHCRDQRIFAADENGFTATCKCGTVTRPWSELMSFSENDRYFAFNTKMGGQVLPKSAFSSEAEITEFRTLVSGKLNQDKAVTTPHFDFVFKPEDYSAAFWLHIVKGGGWRYWAKKFATGVIAAYGCFVIWRYISATRDPIVLVGLLGLLVGAPLLGPILRRSKNKNYVGQIRIYFSDEGMHAQYPTRQSRWLWPQFIGYLENNSTLLIYVTPRMYSVIPKRALAGQTEKRFQAVVESKLIKYNYRNPVVGETELSTALNK